MIKIYDNTTRSLRELSSIERARSACMSAVRRLYNYIHVGNARSTVAFDTVRSLFYIDGGQLYFQFWRCR